jgi:hypothetical protein
MAVSFIEATTGQCRYFVADTTGMNGLVCGDAVTEPGRSYCVQHHRLVFQPLKPATPPRIFDPTSAANGAADDSEPDLTEMFE